MFDSALQSLPLNPKPYSHKVDTKQVYGLVPQIGQIPSNQAICWVIVIVVQVLAKYMIMKYFGNIGYGGN